MSEDTSELQHHMQVEETPNSTKKIDRILLLDSDSEFPGIAVLQQKEVKNCKSTLKEVTNLSPIGFSSHFTNQKSNESFPSNIQQNLESN